MKTSTLTTTLLVCLALGSTAFAKTTTRPRVGRKSMAPTRQQQQDLTQQLDGMNGDQDVIRRAKEMSTDGRVEVVQNRAVDRTNKHEFSANYGAAAFGDTYLLSQTFGAQYDYHITNHWSLGARFYSYNNSLTSEGENAMSTASQRQASNQSYRYPQIDEPKHVTFATVTWYPIYGKTNMFDWTVVHFDFYTVGGVGSMQLNSGQTVAFTGGGGLGLWWTDWLTSRLEIRWMGYEDRHFDGNRRLNVAIATFGMGVMF